jgi:hypothetical protein
VDVLERLLTRLQKGRTKVVSSPAERRYIHSVLGAWFGQYHPAFLKLLGDEQLLAKMDELMREILQRAMEKSARRTVIRTARAARQYFTGSLLIPLSRSYWSRAPQQTPAGRDEEVALRLRQLDPELAASYEQGVLDIEDEARVSYRGPAAELREMLTTVLHILAPNDKVQATDWYREARRSGVRTENTPTRAERVRLFSEAELRGQLQPRRPKLS